MKDKLLNLVILTLSFLLILSYFNSSKKDENISKWIKIETQSSYTVPAWLKIKILNSSPEQFVFNSCDLKIKKDSNIIKNYVCKDLKIDSWKSLTLDFAKFYDKFYDSWEYFILLNTKYWEIISKFEIENKWFFSKLFVFLFYAPIYNLMAYILEFTNYHLWFAIIIITLIIRFILLVPQHKIMKSQKKMQLIQPKIKEIQEKYKWNHQMLWMELLNLYKKENVNPMWSFWLLLIQMPILLVIYNVIVWIKDYSSTYYLYSFLQDYKITSIISDFYGMDLFKIWWINWFILAIIVALLQFIQIKLSLSYQNNDTKKTWVVLEKKKDQDDYQSFMPDPEFLNKFMLYWMPVMIWIATYTFFAWVWIYWWIGTIFMIIQQLVVNKFTSNK